jgi:hypothetical protein
MQYPELTMGQLSALVYRLKSCHAAVGPRIAEHVMIASISPCRIGFTFLMLLRLKPEQTMAGGEAVWFTITAAKGMSGHGEARAVKV